jgi:hypothetical protein
VGIGLSYALGISRQLTPLEVLMIRTSQVVPSPKTYRQFLLTNKLATPFTKRKIARSIRTVGLTLLALTFAEVVHAQGTMDFSGAQTLMGTFKTFAMYAGAVICLGGLIFAGIRMMSGRFQDAIPGLFGALFGAGVLGWGAGWIGSLTGQSM